MKKLRKLNKRELVLLVLTVSTLLSAVYYILLLKPMLNKIKAAEEMNQQLTIQETEIKSKLETNSIVQQQASRLNEAKALEAELAQLKAKKTITDMATVTKLLESLGDIDSYQAREQERTADGILLNITIKHDTNYLHFKSNIDHILNSNTSLKLKLVKLENKKYTSEWSAWIKK